MILLASASSAASAVDCGPYKIISVQAQQDDVLVRLVGAGTDIWKSLGAWSSPSTKPYLAVTQQALAMNRAVYLRYSDGYTCAVTDYGTQPMMIRLDATQ